MRTVRTLLDECVTKCEGQSALARRLGMNAADVNDLVRGRRPVSPAMVGLLCDVMELDGEEARRLAAEAIIATAKAEKRGVLRRAFFALSLVGVGCGAVMEPTEGQSPETTTSGTVYTLWRVWRRWLQRLGLPPSPAPCFAWVPKRS